MTNNEIIRETLQLMKSTVEDQIKFGPSEAAMHRLEVMIETLEEVTHDTN